MFAPCLVTSPREPSALLYVRSVCRKDAWEDAPSEGEGWWNMSMQSPRIHWQGHASVSSVALVLILVSMGCGLVRPSGPSVARVTPVPTDHDRYADADAVADADANTNTHTDSNACAASYTDSDSAAALGLHPRPRRGARLGHCRLLRRWQQAAGQSNL